MVSTPVEEEANVVGVGDVEGEEERVEGSVEELVWGRGRVPLVSGPSKPFVFIPSFFVEIDFEPG